MHNFWPKPQVTLLDAVINIVNNYLLTKSNDMCIAAE